MTTATGRAQQREMLAYAAELVEQAGALIVTAGAGIGVDAGLPDFRGDEGFWRAYPALRRAKLGFQDVATPACFDDYPYQAWGFYGHRLALYRDTAPHRGFDLLANWSAQKSQGYTVFTSNVDGLFLRAGFAPGRLHECHGSLHYLQCSVPCTPAVWSAQQLVVEVDASSCTWLGDLPRCPHCGALARPNILMFNDSRWVAGRSEQQERQQEMWLAALKTPLVIEIGAGTAQRTVRTFGQRMVTERTASLLRINPDGKQDENADVVIAMPALRALAAIDVLLQARAQRRAAPVAHVPAFPSEVQPSPARAGRVGKKHAEQTLRRRLTLLALLPDAGRTGISVQALTTKLGEAGYPCSRRTVERDLAEMADPERAWRAAGIDIESLFDPANPRLSLWAHRTPAGPPMLGVDRMCAAKHRCNQMVAPGLAAVQGRLDRAVLGCLASETLDLLLRSAPGQAGDQLMANFVKTPLGRNQCIVPLPAGGHELSATVQHTSELVWMLQAHAHLLQVMAPANLRQELVRFAVQVAAQYAVHGD